MFMVTEAQVIYALEQLAAGNPSATALWLANILRTKKKLELTADERRAYQERGKVAAIQMVKNRLDLSLLAAKEFVESEAARLDLRPPVPKPLPF